MKLFFHYTKICNGFRKNNIDEILEYLGLFSLIIHLSSLLYHISPYLTDLKLIVNQNGNLKHLNSTYYLHIDSRKHLL